MANMLLEDIWSSIVNILKKTPCKCRLKIVGTDEITDWDSPLFEPVPGYLELKKYGPISKREIEWLEVDPLVSKKLGRLLPVQEVSYTDQLIEELSSLQINILLNDKFLRISLNDRSTG